MVSLTIRILISIGLLAIAGFSVFMNPILDRVERQYLEAIEEPMVDTAEILAGILAMESNDEIHIPSSWSKAMRSVENRNLDAKIYNLRKQQVQMDFYITDSQGIVIFDSGNTSRIGNDFSEYLDVYKTLNGAYGARTSRQLVSDPTSTVMYVAAPIFNGREIIGVLSVYKPQRSMLLFINETQRRLIQVGLLTLGLLLLLAWLLSKWVTYPLTQLTEYAAAVSLGERPKAPTMPGKHLRILGESTEAMRDALENRKYVESYVQSLTLEMKSPIAGIRGSVELLNEKLPQPKREQFHQNIKLESVRLQNLVEQLLALASLENRTEPSSPTAFSLNRLIESIERRHRSDLLSRELFLRIEAPTECTINGEEFLIETAVSNLLKNAIDFSPTGGVIEIRLREEANSAQLSITDEGTGIPDYALSKIFTRFFSLPRPGSEHKSSGLGLCFAKEALELHGSSLTLSNRKDATGVIALIEFKELIGI